MGFAIDEYTHDHAPKISPDQKPAEQDIATNLQPNEQAIEKESEALAPDVQQLRDRVKSIEKKLPEYMPDELRNELRQLMKAIASAQWPTSDDPIPAEVVESISNIETEIGKLDSLKFLPEVDTNRSALDRKSRAVVDGETKKTSEQISLAIETVEAEWQPRLRQQTLELRDRKDEAAKLRQQIVAAQRSRSSQQSRTSRATAMQQDLADIRRYLTAFTTPGHYQPNHKSIPSVVEQTIDARPVSLTRLDALGALKPTIEGLERLFQFGSGDFNDRPQGSFPEFYNYEIRKPHVLATIRRAQNLLRDHGQAMVEAGMLSR